MNKQSAPNSENTTGTLSFLEFWLVAAQELGDARLKINPNAQSAKQLLAANSDHREFLPKILLQSYQRSRCQHLRDTINLNVVLDVLGETAYSLKGQQADDLLDIELLEELAWIISQRYLHHLDIPQSTQSNIDGGTNTRIIALDKVKILQANRRL
ncbi:hypothetical protein GCM10008090_07140 [Arenicella chitinivorans]|uniref:Uncharacterized protein n=1 Tax=Arenicella chitinivorans TaxID=1329800 RepID=A0A918RKN3_9GAMM|nr:hypothetical protein [Arenicella chitinivorans]GHA00726.1 hypothetical protein GCM10008090_07140 [Arenicella chitinivorans]